MAIYHLSATPVQRSKGQTATAGAAYRSASVIRDERTAVTHDFTRKRGVVQSEILAPENAPQWVHDRAALWNRAELAEKRADGQPAREIRLGLPHELTDEQRADLVFNYARDVFVSNGMVADISIHRPDRHGDERNHHAHIYVTMRELDGDRFSARKNRDWNHKDTLEHWREQWEEYQNAALEDAGSDARVDCRTLEAQGINHLPTEHLGRDANAMERRGIATERGDRNRAIQEHNQKIDQFVNELTEVQAEISRELEREFFEPEEEPGIENPSFPTTQEELALSWEEQKAAAQNSFESEIVKAYESQIREQGEVSEYGLGRNWFDRTLVMFENIYYDTIEQVRGFWEKVIGGRGRDRDRSVRRDDPDSTPDREDDPDLGR